MTSPKRNAACSLFWPLPPRIANRKNSRQCPKRSLSKRNKTKGCHLSIPKSKGNNTSCIKSGADITSELNEGFHLPRGAPPSKRIFLFPTLLIQSFVMSCHLHLVSSHFLCFLVSPGICIPMRSCCREARLICMVARCSHIPCCHRRDPLQLIGWIAFIHCSQRIHGS